LKRRASEGKNQAVPSAHGWDCVGVRNGIRQIRPFLVAFFLPYSYLEELRHEKEHLLLVAV
jgi:hypothetical protein